MYIYIGRERARENIQSPSCRYRTFYGLSLRVINVRSSLPVQPDQKDRVGILPGDGDTSPCPGGRGRERERERERVREPCFGGRMRGGAGFGFTALRCSVFKRKDCGMIWAYGLLMLLISQLFGRNLLDADFRLQG